MYHMYDSWIDYSRRLVYERSVTGRRPVGDRYAATATALRLNSVVASLLSKYMYKH